MKLLSTPPLFRKLQKKAVLTLASFLLFSATIFAQPVNFVILDMPAAPVAVGNSFTVRVAIDFIGATPPLGVDALEVHLGFDRTKLQVTAQSLLPPVSAFGAVAIPLEGAPYTNTNTDGEVQYAGGTLGAIPTADFDIMSITFLVTAGAGTTTPLDFIEILAPPVFKLTDAQRIGNSVKNAATDATLTISAAACTTPVVTLTGTAACGAGLVTINLASSSAGAAPFDLTINGNVYNNIAVGADIPTPFTIPTQNIFGTGTPPVLDITDGGGAVELGVRFTASVNGFVKGIRFFSNTVPVGTYTGHLFSETGTLLASATFSSVTGGAWNEVLFTTPVYITTSNDYIASYHTTTGTYTAEPSGLNSNISNGQDLVALASNPPTAPNGVYNYGPAGTFPTSFFGNANYYADVIFAPESFTYNLTSVTDNLGCTSLGTPNLQSLVVTSVDCPLLPVTLNSFSATTRDNNVTLRWVTSSELNNKGFEIMRSTTTNGGWQSIGFVNGAGTSNSTKTYTYLDANLPAKRYFYQLKQIDIDNRSKMSAVVSAVINGKLAFNLEQNFPNPFRGESTNIRFTLPHRENVNLSLFDLNGRLVKVLVNGTKDEGTHVIPFEAGSLGAGVYYYKIQAGDNSAVKKMTIQ